MERGCAEHQPQHRTSPVLLRCCSWSRQHNHTRRQNRRLTPGIIDRLEKRTGKMQVPVSNLRQSRRLEEGGAAQSRMALRAEVPLPNLSAVGATSSEAKSRICRSSGAWKFPSGPATTMPRPRRSHQLPLVRYAIRVKYSRNCQTSRVLRQSRRVSFLG